MFTTLMGISLICVGIGGLCRFIEDEVEVLEGVVGGLKGKEDSPINVFMLVCWDENKNFLFDFVE